MMDEDIGYNFKIMRNKWIDWLLHLTYKNFLKYDKSITEGLFSVLLELSKNTLRTWTY